MSFDDLMVWLVMAMGLTAVVFLLWTLVALVRDSRALPFGIESERGSRLSGLAPRDRGSA
jgi:hypothetical protein